MTITSINPATGKDIQTYTLLTDEQLRGAMESAQSAFVQYKRTSLQDRKQKMSMVAKILRAKKNELGLIITKEMGKRLVDSIAEIEKCAVVCEYYINESERILAHEMITTEAKESFVRFDPLGIIFIVMPWNFPFWQVFRAAVPALMAGNTMLLKHASNVPGCALEIEKVFQEAGFDNHIFTTLLINSSQVPRIIEDTRIKAVSLTGSEAAGVSVGSLAAKNLKKSVLELGGSDPFIVCEDADVEAAVSAATQSRLIVTGQSCIAAKRFLVHESILESFTKLFKESLESKRVGDPMDEKTDVGPLSSQHILDAIHTQVQDSIQMGAVVLTGGKQLSQPGFYYPPTLLNHVTLQMPVFREETFGPVACIVPFSSDTQALEIANSSRFGLGSSIWTNNATRAQLYIQDIEAGAVFLNSMVRSDPRLPFGGTKASGYGRELSAYGMKEFVNIKSVWIQS